MDLVVDGRRTFAATGGVEFDPDLPAVVLVHGAGMDRTVWALHTRYLAHHGRSVLAVDLPGHGRSEGEPLGSIEAQAAWLVALLDAAGVDQASMAGHSMGALAALECAGTRPERVRALVLCGVAERMPVHPDLLADARAGDHHAIELVDAWSIGRVAHLGGNATPGVWLHGTVERLMEHAPPGTLAIDLAACDAYGPTSDIAGTVQCPTLLILGEDDVMTPAKRGVRLAETIPEARVEILSRTGHMMLAERPAETLRLLADVL